MADFTIQKGKTFTRVWRWMSPEIAYSPITAISAAAPAIVTSESHGVPNGWPVAIVSVKGMRQINAQNDPPKTKEYRKATVRDQDTIELNEINASEFSPYVSGGYVMYRKPIDLDGFSARMEIKDQIGGTALETLTTDNGKLDIDTVACTITATLAASATTDYDWSTGVFDLEMVNGEKVYLLDAGIVVTCDEVTT